jgi:hypothetical protein
MDMKPTTPINGPAVAGGKIAHCLNLVKTTITLQDRRNKLTARRGTFINAAPLRVTVQISVIVTSLSF